MKIDVANGNTRRHWPWISLRITVKHHLANLFDVGWHSVNIGWHCERRMSPVEAAAFLEHRPLPPHPLTGCSPCSESQRQIQAHFPCRLRSDSTLKARQFATRVLQSFAFNVSRALKRSSWGTNVSTVPAAGADVRLFGGIVGSNLITWSIFGRAGSMESCGRLSLHRGRPGNATARGCGFAHFGDI